MAQVNENILYQPDERPSHPASLVLGFQSVMTRMAAMAATTSIIAVAGGQSQGYLSWIFFSVSRGLWNRRYLADLSILEIRVGIFPQRSLLHPPSYQSVSQRCWPAVRRLLVDPDRRFIADTVCVHRPALLAAACHQPVGRRDRPDAAGLYDNNGRTQQAF